MGLEPAFTQDREVLAIRRTYILTKNGGLSTKHLSCESYFKAFRV
jgi:hypothetical protein